jgi:hypothetical protein
MRRARERHDMPGLSHRPQAGDAVEKLHRALAGHGLMRNNSAALRCDMENVELECPKN